MIPWWLKIKIPRQDREPFFLTLPLLLVWLLLILIMIILLPFLLLFGLLFWFKWYGKLAIFIFPLLFSVLWHLKGLHIDIEDRDGQIYLSFV